jgi:hypothetical protein
MSGTLFIYDWILLGLLFTSISILYDRVKRRNPYSKAEWLIIGAFTVVMGPLLFFVWLYSRWENNARYRRRVGK